tara:strand:- start:34 stop:246 length:213 start_codon:yes stop_codon:yes gene_type:complete
MATDRPGRNAVDRRVECLDTIAAVLPMERRDELAELLSDQDVETLRHLVNRGQNKSCSKSYAKLERSGNA